MRRCIQMVCAFLIPTIPVIPMCLFGQGSLQATEQQGSGMVINRKLAISTGKTSLLVFPVAIQSADRGAGYVLAERVKDAGNVLKVKAGREGFAPSSLSVITVDGRVYVFRVFYSENPPALVQDFREEAPVGRAVHFKDGVVDRAALATAAESVRASAPFLRRVKTSEYGLCFRLGGVYIFREVVYLKFRLWNSSGISYALSSLDFFIRDLTTAKRTAMRDKDLQPVYRHTWGAPEDKDGQLIVVALPRFTIADKKKLAIELMEKEGDRSLSLELRERKFRKAKQLYQQ